MRIVVAGVWAFTCLAAVQASGQGASRRASASNTASGGFRIRGPVVFSDSYEDGSGQVTVDARQTLAGDRLIASGRVRAEIRSGADSYRVELNVNPEVGGAVLIDRDIHGNTGLGSAGMPAVHAVAALSGYGQVTKNGRVLAEHAAVEVMALSAGAHADDSTHRLQAQARGGDGEIEVVAQGLPLGDEPNGFLDFVWDDVRLELDGLPVPTIQTVPTGMAASSLSPTAEGARLMAPTTLAGTGPGGYAMFAPGTGGAGQAGTTAAGQPTAIATPDSSGTARATAAAANGSFFTTANNGPAERTPGIPASPIVLNNGAAGLVVGPGLGPAVPPSFNIPATPLVSSPSLLSSGPALPLPAGIAPLNASPASGATPANPVPTGPSTATGTPGVTPAR